MIVYVSGPMTGLPEHNLPAFAAAADRLADAGFEPRNPGYRGVIEGYTWQDYLRDALRLLLDCDAVALLPGWETSRGALLEVRVATDLGMPCKPLDEALSQGMT